MRERESDLLFHLLIYALVASGLCPDLGSNLRPWHIGMMLSPPDLTSDIPEIFLSFVLVCCKVLANVVIPLGLPSEGLYRRPAQCSV